MSKATILLIDNDRNFLEAGTELFRSKGYDVIATQELQEARNELAYRTIDLAIIDIRLVDDDDDEDLSGLVLANELPTSLPKIILTGFPSYETLRDILGSTSGHEPSSTRFISKAEGLSALVATIESALKSLSGDSTTDAPPPKGKKKKRRKGK